MAIYAKQGQIGWMNLSPTVGHEQGRRRPVLIVSNNYFNQHNGGMVKVVPVTTNEKEFPLHIELPDDLPIEGKVLLEHERSIDIVSRKFEVICEVSDDYMKKIVHLMKLTY
ncbi:type II toxin-antitoxin system PemK/MazF family toxin [Lactobacillus salivarius]|uniref:type II toxin-antitoxin system PemK/MazF family toxin n=1 Tax=Ligilactobacillus salivarius TaxID=1624 RepID=UPI0015C6000A|nr:type II toxin-antitoxin system PemK/MazF family toxin [Ligilactobacillus salivarius]NXZ96380.1 type II toxin-antitoxin system PemK/MazF family toxin [Ligilactobacillus salivarius]NYA58717.1 type II toxin-antitoxin system PemK/MazF family toxin [Ligilactobacillus salivarius]NYA60540.1 type II toxin-antitoxin system PemK/MazF family toxin [Ligilactobacillus salivarius]NYA62500.1 type II toxin-antitoxin system PemK/MazF family toxin [Ligilactobacillus salivarius]NYA66694.1 type II toxin-antito